MTTIASSNLTLGLLFFGRERPGFDLHWGAEIRNAVRQQLQAHAIRTIVPTDTIATTNMLSAALEHCRQQAVDGLVVLQPTISDGRLAAPLLAGWQQPLILWATPERPNSNTISANSLVGTHVFAATIRQLGGRFECVYGHPNEERCIANLLQAVACVRAATLLTRANIGLIGAHAPGFVDFHVDPMMLQRQLGCTLHHIGMLEFLDRLKQIEIDAITRDMQTHAELRLPSVVDDKALRMQSRYYLTFNDILDSVGLDGLAFRCWPDLPNSVGHWPYVALARLVSEQRAVAMEGDVDGALCSLIAHGARFGTTYLSDWLEHDDHGITIWHTGAAPFDLCEPIGSATGPRIGVQFNNQLPSVVDADIRADRDITLFRLWRCDGCYRLTALQGHSEKPLRRLPGTNGRMCVPQLNVRDWFDEMIQAGMPHHVSIVAGHHAETLRRIARLLDIAWMTGQRESHKE